MKTTKTLLAVSLLAAAGAASADTYTVTPLPGIGYKYSGTNLRETVNYVDYGILGNILCSQADHGAAANTQTAILNTGAQTLDIYINDEEVRTCEYWPIGTITHTTTSVHVHFEGTYDSVANTFTPTLDGSTSQVIACTNNGGHYNGCSYSDIYGEAPFDAVGGSVTDVTGGAFEIWTVQWLDGTSTRVTYDPPGV